MEYCNHLVKRFQEELKRDKERAESTEKDVHYLEYQLRMVGENMKLIELSEENSLEREEKYLEQIFILHDKLKIADRRQEYGEKNINKLNHRMDQIEDEIIRQKQNIQKDANELDDVYKRMVEY